MLLQTNSSSNVYIIDCEDHVSSDGSTTSPDSSFESHGLHSPTYLLVVWYAVTLVGVATPIHWICRVMKTQ